MKYVDLSKPGHEFKEYWGDMDKFRFSHGTDGNKTIAPLYNPRNTVTNFYLADNPKQIKDSFKNEENKKKLIDNGWCDEEGNIIKDIIYHFDHWGFRHEDNELPKKVDFLALGCSATFGAAEQVESTWPFLLAEQNNLTYRNLGVCGGGWETIYRILKHWLPIIDATHILILPPATAARRELLAGDRYYHVSPRHEIFKMPPMHGHFWYDEEIYMANQRARDAIMYVCSEHGHTPIIYDFSCFVLDQTSWGRDCLHPGVVTHQQWANWFKKQITPQ